MNLLITLLVFFLVFGLFVYVFNQFPIPAPFKQISLAILALVFLLVCLNMLGLLGAPYWRFAR